MNPGTQERTLVDEIVRGYRNDAHVRTALPGGGSLNLDRKLPSLLVYRRPPDRPDVGTDQIVLGEASYLVAAGPDDQVGDITRALAEAGTAEFGAFLVIELWAGDAGSRSFVVHAPDGPGSDTADAMRRALKAMPPLPGGVDVRVHSGTERHPPDAPPLLTVHECWEMGCLLIGLEVPPLYRDDDGNLYPVFLRRLRGVLSRALRKTIHAFSRVHTTADVASYQALGPAHFTADTFAIDHELAEIESTYELLFLVSPLNSSEAWRSFRDTGFERAPEFHYRLLPVDPDVLKRRLYNLELDRVADPAMAFLLTDKRDELDRQVTMLAERNTPDFRYASIRLYKPVDNVLLDVAQQVLEQVEPPGRPEEPTVGAEEFATLARAAIEGYRQALPDIAARVTVRPDLTGLLVSRGNLYIGETLRLRRGRVPALLHHEVGTHVLTWYNGKAQPLRQLSTGLAGYDELQEAIAVFSEYLAGGLDAARMRLLAARVLAARSVEDGASFVDTFRLLSVDHGFSPAGAFDICERVHASGGFTRDLIYMRGVLRLLDYLADGGPLEPLYIGKLAARHVDVLAELQERGFLETPPLVPAILDQPGVQQRIAAARDGLTLIDLVNG